MSTWLHYVPYVSKYQYFSNINQMVTSNTRLVNWYEGIIIVFETNVDWLIAIKQNPLFNIFL